MALRKEELEELNILLERYHGKLTDPVDKSLKKSMNKLLQVYNDPLFKALIDISEYYDVTVDSEQRSREAYRNQIDAYPKPIPEEKAEKKKKKKGKAGKRASKEDDLEDEYEPPSGPPPVAAKPTVAPKPAVAPRPAAQSALAAEAAAAVHGRRAPPSPPSPRAQQQQKRVSREELVIGVDPERPTSYSGDVAGGVTMELPGSEWEYDEITLNKGATGFGFSIAGGTDQPQLPDDPSVLISKIVPNGAAHLDGRLQMDDVIMAVNGIGMEFIEHDQAVAALKQSGNQLTLVIRRLREGLPPPPGDFPPSPPEMMAEGGYLVDVELVKPRGGGGLGFSIAGPADDTEPIGIYITKVIPNGLAEQDGRIEIGDRLMEVNGIDIKEATHPEAVEVLKSAGNVVRILILKPEAASYDQPDPGTLPMEMSPPPDSKDKHKKGKKKDKKQKDGQPHLSASSLHESGGAENAEDPDGKEMRKSKSFGGIFGKKKKK